MTLRVGALGGRVTRNALEQRLGLGLWQGTGPSCSLRGEEVRPPASVTSLGPEEHKESGMLAYVGNRVL